MWIKIRSVILVYFLTHLLLSLESLSKLFISLSMRIDCVARISLEPFINDFERKKRFRSYVILYIFWQVKHHIDEALSLHAKPSEPLDRHFKVCFFIAITRKCKLVLNKLNRLRFSVVGWSQKCSCIFFIYTFRFLYWCAMNCHMRGYTECKKLILS